MPIWRRYRVNLALDGAFRLCRQSSIIAIISDNSRSRIGSSSSRKTTTKDRTQPRAKLFAGDEVDVEVIGEDELRQGVGDGVAVVPDGGRGPRLLVHDDERQNGHAGSQQDVDQ